MSAAPPIIRTASVARSVDDAFQIFTETIGSWWPLASHGVFGDRSGGLRFADGRLIETALDGSESVWGEVITWDPPHSFSMTWHPGRQEGPTSTVAVEFRPEGDGTTVRLEHRGWEAFGADASARRRSMVGRSAWGHVLDHFTDSAEV